MFQVIQTERSFKRLVPAAVVALLITTSAAAGLTVDGQCLGDGNNDGLVEINEVIRVVNHLLTGCPDERITLQFEGVVGNQPFACGNEYPGLGTNGGTLTPADFSFYVHDIRLVTAAGDEVALELDQDTLWQHTDIALIDFEDATPPCDNGTAPTNSIVMGVVPAGTYTGLRFRVGVPFAMNHQQPALAASPLNLTRLWWNWQAGYKFIRVDDAANSTRIHLGSTGCEASDTGDEVISCARPNRPEVVLDEFDPYTNVIVVDLAAVFADSELGVNQPDTKPGCQSEPFDLDCVPIMANLGVDFDTGEAVPGQVLFGVE